ncbi:MAG: hypothetical protein Q4C82_08720 [Eubacteriales bacterium]|nr:hypothetical protein [Eubacteriales bacterium]
MRKRIWQSMGAALLGCLLLALPVQAAPQGEVSWSAEDGAQAVLAWPEDAEEEIRSLQLSFEIENAGNAKISFAFDEGITSKVKEYRYQNGTLTVYVAGSENLRTAETLTLGEVKAEAAGAETVTVKVTPKADSLRLVNGASSMEDFALESVVGTEITAEGKKNPDGGSGGSGSGSSGSGSADSAADSAASSTGSSAVRAEGNGAGTGSADSADTSTGDSDRNVPDSQTETAGGTETDGGSGDAGDEESASGDEADGIRSGDASGAGLLLAAAAAAVVLAAVLLGGWLWMTGKKSGKKKKK